MTKKQKTIEFYEHGVREVIQKKGCKSCLDCKHCQMLNSSTICTLFQKTSLHTHNFPYDNTNCKSWGKRDE